MNDYLLKFIRLAGSIGYLAQFGNEFITYDEVMQILNSYSTIKKENFFLNLNMLQMKKPVITKNDVNKQANEDSSISKYVYYIGSYDNNTKEIQCQLDNNIKTEELMGYTQYLIDVAISKRYVKPIAIIDNGNNIFLMTDKTIKNLASINPILVNIIYTNESCLICALGTYSPNKQHNRIIQSLIIAIHGNKVILCSYIGNMINTCNSLYISSAGATKFVTDISFEAYNISSFDEEMDKGIALLHLSQGSKIIVGLFETSLRSKEATNTMKNLLQKAVSFMTIGEKNKTTAIIILPSTVKYIDCHTKKMAIM